MGLVFLLGKDNMVSLDIELIEVLVKCVGFWLLFLVVIGVVYGDIGILLFYVFCEVMYVVGVIYGGVLCEDVLGVLLLIVWVLVLVVMVKYVLILLWVDNEGEGGMLLFLVLV